MIINRMLQNKVSISSFKRENNILKLYFSAITKDNITILGELSLYISTEIYGKIKYRSENLTRQIEFENFMNNILSKTNELSSFEGSR